jgi:hypothetical protein
MTVFRTRSDRAIARSRGHLKLAEAAYQNEAAMTMSFSMSKANHALAIGRLHESRRLADAAEIRTIIEFLRQDPEGEVGSILAPEEAEQLGVKVRTWLVSQVNVEEVGDDD